MAEPDSSSTAGSSSRGRGRGRSRGGLGKYLRARGRGHRGGGRPAEFSSRLLLEGEGKVQLTEEEEEERQRELAAKYSRRQLGTNADRYKEEEPELDSDGEAIVEPEVDLSGFLEKQRNAQDTHVLGGEPQVQPDDDDDVDHSLAHITSSLGISSNASRKGKVEVVEWDHSLQEMALEKKAAEATWDLKDRFRAKSARLRSELVPPSGTSTRPKKGEYKQAPALPTDGAQAKPKAEMEQLEDFLDELLT